MAREPRVVEFKTFDKGIITEVNPLSFPESASIDEVNFIINHDGTRQRRNGIEPEGAAIEVGNSSDDPELPTSSFLWENVAGYNAISLVVVQYGGEITAFNTDTDNLVDGIVAGSVTLPNYDGATLATFAVSEGSLIIAYGDAEIITVTGTVEGSRVSSLSSTSARLTIRDTFGDPVTYEDAVKGKTISLFDPLYTDVRPTPSGLGTGGGPAESLTSNSTKKTTNSYFSSVEADGGNGIGRLFGLQVAKWHTVATNNNSNDHQITFASSNPDVDAFALKNTFTDVIYTFTRKSGLVWETPFNQTEHNWFMDNAPTGLNLLQEGATEIVESAHLYNLRNQSFARKRIGKTGDTLIDTASVFVALNGVLPSNADTVNSALYPNTEETNKTVDRFHPEDLEANKLGKLHAPRGHFIIDALDRSGTRLERWKELVEDEGYAVGEATFVSHDVTERGAKAVVEYSGRMWYGGFEEKGGRASETRLESYLLYSQLSNSVGAATRCYQAGDPTSIDEPDVLATDGGVLSLDGAYGIKKLVVIGNSLLAFAENGVWAVSGSDGNYFSPLSQRVQKITDKGGISPRALVVVDATVMYWALDGIYSISLTEDAGYQVESITDATVQSLFHNIPNKQKRTVTGKYAAFESQVVWLVGNTRDLLEETQLLTLHLKNGAFSRSVISESPLRHRLIEQVNTPAFTLRPKSLDVVNDDVAVVQLGEQIIYVTQAIEETDRTVKYMSVRPQDVGLHGTPLLCEFNTFTNTDYEDWGIVDAPAYIVTGYINAEDNYNTKRVSYATFHFERTEDGFFEEEDGDLTPINESSCKVQAQWDWTNSVNSGRWGREFQAYRYKRLYIPTSPADTYDTGFSTIVTKNKLRGKGRVVSLKLATEPRKNCKVLGWMMEMY